jgi:hypothetical protein
MVSHPARRPPCAVKVISDVSSVPELRDALRGLVGSRVTDIGRAAGMVELGFEKDGKVHRLHVQCAFRVVREGMILVGTTDMSFPQDRQMDPGVAYESRTTRFDGNARMLTDRFQAGAFQVTGTELAGSGSFVIELSHDLRFEAMPVCSGPFEAWRLFVKGDTATHHVYPESSLYDGYPNYANHDWPEPE